MGQFLGDEWDQTHRGLLADWGWADPIERGGKISRGAEPPPGTRDGGQLTGLGRLVSLKSSVDLLPVAEPRGACHWPRTIKSRLFAVKTRPGQPHHMCRGEGVEAISSSFG